MVLHFNKSRLYKGTVGVSHGVLVELLRHTRHFWDSYKDLLRVNGKEQSDSKELRKVMKALVKKPRKKKTSVMKKEKILQRIEKEFDQGLEDLNSMFENLDELTMDDETLLFRAMMDLVELYSKVSDLKHLPEHMHHEMLDHLYKVMEHIDHMQHHTWVLSKAHARGYMKVEEVDLLTSRAERRRLRRQTIELDHLLNRLYPLQEWVMRLGQVKTQDEIKELHKRIVELLKLYHSEISDIHHILHEAHVFVRRTDKLFNSMEKEAEEIGQDSLKEKVHEYGDIFHEIHSRFEEQARREALDINKLLKKCEKPHKAAKKAA